MPVANPREPVFVPSIGARPRLFVRESNSCRLIHPRCNLHAPVPHARSARYGPQRCQCALFCRVSSRRSSSRVMSCCFCFRVSIRVQSRTFYLRPNSCFSSARDSEQPVSPAQVARSAEASISFAFRPRCPELLVDARTPSCPVLHRVAIARYSAPARPTANSTPPH